MTGQLDTKARQVAFDLIAKYGKVATFTERTSETYDPATGSVSGGETPHVWNISPPAPFDRRLVDGDTVQIGDLRADTPALGIPFTPVRGQKVTFDSEDWTIVDFSLVMSGELPAMYSLHMRR